MRFLLDQDVYASTERFLTALGHDALAAGRAGLSQASDSELLLHAADLSRVMITRDRDFGGLVFMQGLTFGVIYLRTTPASIESVHAELRRVLNSYSEDDLRSSFVVVEPARHRIRRLRSPTPHVESPAR